MLFASPLIREIEDKRPDSTSQIIKPSLRGGLPIFAFHVNNFFFLFAGRHDRTIMNCKMFLMLDLLFSIKPPKGNDKVLGNDPLNNIFYWKSYPTPPSES